MSLYYASKYRRLPDGQKRRVESIGFAGLTAAMSVVRDMNSAAKSGVTWVVTIRLGDGSHAPAVIGEGSGAAIALARGRYDLQRGDTLAPPTAA